MTKALNLRKSWIGGAARATTIFNSPGNLTIPYGQFKGTISGRAGTGNDPVAAAYTITYATNYNIAYPIANQPIANQPATAYTILYNTNYNTAYPVANQPEASRPATAYSTNYNTNYNVVYPVANQPEASRPVTAYSTNYNVAYPVANQPEASRPATAYSTNKEPSLLFVCLYPNLGITIIGIDRYDILKRNS